MVRLCFGSQRQHTIPVGAVDRELGEQANHSAGPGDPLVREPGLDGASLHDDAPTARQKVGQPIGGGPAALIHDPELDGAGADRCPEGVDHLSTPRTVVYHKGHRPSTERGPMSGYEVRMSEKSQPRKRVRREGGIAGIPRITLPEPSGHTESIPATLRAARDALGLRQRDVAELLRRDFGIDVGDTAVQSWEVGRNEPTIHVYARWARCVGKRLDVKILDAHAPTVTVEVPAALADAAAAVGELSPSKASAVETIVDALLAMSPSEVKALAFDLQKRKE